MILQSDLREQGPGESLSETPQLPVNREGPPSTDPTAESRIGV